MALPISLEIYEQLATASIRSGFEKETWEIGAAAIREWMARNDPDSFAMPATSGYQWKQLFLPNGTLLRTIFNGEHFNCRVEEDHIFHNGQSVSPSGFANAVGGVRRNAWKVVWILFPNSTTWKLAGTLRAKRHTHKPRSPERQRTGDTAPPPRPRPSTPQELHRANPRAVEQQGRDEGHPRSRREQRTGQDRRQARNAPDPERVRGRADGSAAGAMDVVRADAGT
jgi:hypothetical protein